MIQQGPEINSINHLEASFAEEQLIKHGGGSEYNSFGQDLTGYILSTGTELHAKNKISFKFHLPSMDT